MKLLSQTRGVAGPRFWPWPGRRQPTLGGGLAGWEDGLSPALAPGLPWLSILVQVSGAVQRFQRHLNILEAICQSWKLLGGSRNDLSVPESVAFAEAVVHGFQSGLRSPRRCGGPGPEHADSPGWHWRWSAWQCELPAFSPRTQHPGTCCSEEQEVCGCWQQLCHSRAVCPEANYLTSLGPLFPICKMGVIPPLLWT